MIPFHEKNNMAELFFLKKEIRTCAPSAPLSLSVLSDVSLGPSCLTCGHTIYLTYIAVSISLFSCIQWREPALFPPLQGACVQTLAPDDAHCVMLRCGMIPRVMLSAESCYAESCAMSQQLAVAHRGGQLAYPTWAAHTTTTCRAFFVDGAGRCEGSRQRDQGLSPGCEALHISYM